MKHTIAILLPLSLLVAACNEPAAIAPAAEAAPPAPAAAPPPPPPPPSPVLPEPAGVKANAYPMPAVPASKDGFRVDAAKTVVSFTIVSNSAGPITGRFVGGAAGALAADGKSGAFSVDITTLKSTNKEGAGNPVRDQNVADAFFGARPMQNPATAGAVAAAWDKLLGKIQTGVKTASFVVDSVEPALLVPTETPVAGHVNGTLTLWASVQIPVVFAVTAQKTADGIVVKSSAPTTFNIEQAVGTAVRNMLFDNMLAAGCAHQPGIQNDVSLMLESVVLVPAK